MSAAPRSRHPVDRGRSRRRLRAFEPRTPGPAARRPPLARRSTFVPIVLAALAAAALTASPAAASRASRRTPVVAAVEQVQDAVVSISTDELVRVRAGGDWWEDWYRGYGDAPRYREGYRQLALGSGVIVDPRGYVVTNYHVVRRGARIRVHLHDGRELVADVVGTDPASDLAVLRVKDGTLASVPLAHDDLMLGETVIAIGNPYGLSHTVSTGIVSSLHRNLGGQDRTYFDFIQTDASINPGNSGGPLLNLDGEVVGINTAILGKGQNIGFAIPARRVKRVVDDLIAHGKVRESWLGLMVAPLENVEGVAVTGVLSQSPAAVRVQEGDILVALNGRPVRSPAEYRHRLRDVPVGRDVELTFEHAGVERALTVKTREIPADAADEILARYVGVEVAEIDDRLARQMRLPVRRGLVVTRVLGGSPASRIGLAPGDVVRAVNAVQVAGKADLHRMILRGERAGELVLVIQRGRRLHEVAFPF